MRLLKCPSQNKPADPMVGGRRLLKLNSRLARPSPSRPRLLMSICRNEEFIPHHAPSIACHKPIDNSNLKIRQNKCGNFKIDLNNTL